MSDQSGLNTAVQATGKVLSITDARGQDPTGNWVPGRNVVYQLASGHTGTVWVPLDSFSPEAVKAAVVADATKLAQVANLTF